uniref:(northern house mosquito) hypothetical protein n=2 Tax=Culex pipiens TaxID=7175 RepID=A0A8D8JY37_CULPI
MRQPYASLPWDKTSQNPDRANSSGRCRNIIQQMSRMQQNIYESSRLRSAHEKTSKRQRRSLPVQGMRTEHANEVYARQPHLNAPAPPPKSGRKFHLCQVRQRLSQLEFIVPPCYIAQKDNQKLSLQVQVV